MECSLLAKFRNSRNIAVFIVYVSILIDNMLSSFIAPILPHYFVENDESTTIKTDDTVQTNTTNNNIGDGCDKIYSKNLYATENLLMGFLLAVAPIVQIIANVFVGPFCDRVGYDIPMLVGFVIVIGGCIIFAVGTTYAVMFFARALHGLGSAFLTTAGLAKLAYLFPDTEERGQKMALVLSGLGMGDLVGPAFGSILYQFAGKSIPFIILGGGLAGLTFLHLFTAKLTPINKKKEGEEQGEKKSSTLKMLKDPYILLACFTVFAGNLHIGFIETGLPLWMMSTMCYEIWMLGVAFLPIDIIYIAVTVLFSWLSARSYRWLICMVSFFVGAVGNATLPLGKSFYHLIAPEIVIGVSIGMLDSTIFSIAGYVADIRQNKAYGSVYAAMDAACCAANFMGPLLGGVVISEIGFPWLMYIVAIFYVLYAPAVWFLRKPKPISSEEKRLVEDETTEPVP